MEEREMPEGARLGVSAMDAAHSFQVTLLRALKDALADGDRKQALELMDQLDDYTNMHFLFEETLMIQRAYPRHQAHRQEHDRLIEELRTLRRIVTSPGEGEQPTDPDAIERWLLNHIKTFDRDLAAYIAS